MGRGPFEHKTTSFLPPKPISDEGQRFNQANKETYHFSSFSYSSCPLQIHVCDIRLQEGSASVCWFPFSNLKQTPERCPLGRGIPIASSLVPRRVSSPSQSFDDMESLGRDPQNCWIAAEFKGFHEVASRVIPKCNYSRGQCISHAGACNDHHQGGVHRHHHFPHLHAVWQRTFWEKTLLSSEINGIPRRLSFYQYQYKPHHHSPVQTSLLLLSSSSSSSSPPQSIHLSCMYVNYVNKDLK